MLLEKNLKKLLNQLNHDQVIEIPFGNNDLTLRVFDQGSKIVLSTPVYLGGNFIPSSVRKCASEKPFFEKYSDIKTALHIDENKFQISLSYLDDLENLKRINFGNIIEQFSTIADEWRLVLDENDKNDLVHVHAK